MSDPVMAAFLLAEHLGVRNMKDMTDCWEHQVDDAWWLAINPRPVDKRCKKGVIVPAYSMYVEYLDWPAGVLPFSRMARMGDGGFADGSVASVDAFVKAIEARMAQ